MQKLKVDLDLKDGDNYIAVSDRSPVSFLFFFLVEIIVSLCCCLIKFVVLYQGLIRAIKIELPKMEHRKCVRHIYGNL